MRELLSTHPSFRTEVALGGTPEGRPASLEQPIVDPPEAATITARPGAATDELGRRLAAIVVHCGRKEAHVREQYEQLRPEQRVAHQ